MTKTLQKNVQKTSKNKSWYEENLGNVVIPFSPLLSSRGRKISSPTSYPSNKCARLCESGTSPKLLQISAALLFQKVSIKNARIKVAKGNTITLQIRWFMCFFFKISFQNWDSKAEIVGKKENAKMTAIYGNLYWNLDKFLEKCLMSYGWHTKFESNLPVRSYDLHGWKHHFLIFPASFHGSNRRVQTISRYVFFNDDEDTLLDGNC